MTPLAFPIHFTALAAVILIAAVIAGYALVRDPVEGRFEFVVLAVTVGLWTIDTGWMMFLSTDVGLLFGYYVQAFFEWVTPALFLVFVAAYSRNRGWIETIPVRIYLIGFPVLFLVASFTNPIHGLMLTEITFHSSPFGYATPSPGPLFYLAKIYSYTSLLTGLILLARISIRSRRITRRQVAALGVTTVLVIGASIAQFFQIAPVDGFNYSLVAFGLFYAALGYLFLRRPALDIGPLARQRLLESLDTGAIILTGEHKIADYNKAASLAFPRLTENIGSDAADVIGELFEEIDDGRPEPVDTVTTTVGDEQYEFSVEVSDVEDGDEVRGYGVVLNDVTDLRAYARQLEEKSDQLDQFASMVSHDLRAPLSAAQTKTGFVIQQVDDEEVTSFANDTIEALDRAEELVEDLLTLAREGRSIQDREYIKLNDLVSEAHETSPVYPENGVIDVGDVYVYADAERLRTVVENLLRNATDHVGEDAKVKIGRLEDKVGFYIEDDGPGIPDDQIDEVFEHGFTTHSEGTGLGLSIVDSIVDAHGWEITANKGTEFGGARFEIETGEFASPEEVESGNAPTHEDDE